MLRKLRPRSIYDVFALLALFVAVGGTSAYAANTIFSTDIVDGQVKSVDIGNGEVNSADVKDQSLTTFDVSTFLGADIVDGTLTSADVAPGTFVAGRGQLLSNRIVLTPADVDTLLDIPGFGSLTATCFLGTDGAAISWSNSTGGPVDVWPSDESGAVLTAGQQIVPVRDNESRDLVLGTGNDPGPRRVATLHLSALQTADGAPCGFQAQGTVWTSP